MQPEPRSQEPQQQAGQQRTQGRAQELATEAAVLAPQQPERWKRGRGKRGRFSSGCVHSGHQTSPAEQGDRKAAGCFASDLGFCCE